ncbi:MAG: PilN domain-containing protein [Phycisphaerae bacterium]
MPMNDTSFLPEDYLEKKQRRRADAICGLLFVVVLGGIGAAFFIAERSLREVEARQVETTERYALAAQRIEQVKQMDTKQQTMARQADLATALLERVPRSNLLAEVTNLLPPRTSLLDLKLESKVRRPAATAKPLTAVEKKKAAKAAAKTAAQAPAEALRYDVTVTLEGVADTDIEISQYITSLQASPLLQRVELRKIEPFEQKRTSRVTNEKKDSVLLRRFEISFEINPAAVVEPGEPSNTASNVPQTLADADTEADTGDDAEAGDENEEIADEGTDDGTDDLATLPTGEAQ